MRPEERFGHPADTSQYPASVSDFVPSKSARKYLDAEGRRWYQLEETRFPAGQMLFAKILKPVFPTCDIICKSYTDSDGKTSYRYYSYDTVPAVPTDDETGALAAQLLAERIFKDPDRFYNWNTNQRRDTHAHYDFECMPIFFMHPTVFQRSDHFFTARIEESLMRSKSHVSWEDAMRDLSIEDLMRLSKEDRAQFAQAIARLGTWTADESAMRKVLATVPEPLHQILYFPPDIGCIPDDAECYSQHFYRTLRERVAAAQKIIDAYDTTFEP